IAELKALAGQELGVSNWLEVTQQRIDQFAEATGDRQWIHCDPERAARESPYGSTIAHGFLTLSLGPALFGEIFEIRGLKWAVNYGVNRVRFPAPVAAGVKLRLRLHLLEVSDLSGAAQVTLRQTFEVKGQTKPACVAEAVLRLYV
ncbi:MAG: MaoC family dehydratase, partial [Pirellulales bacterium]